MTLSSKPVLTRIGSVLTILNMLTMHVSPF